MSVRSATKFRDDYCLSSETVLLQVATTTNDSGQETWQCGDGAVSTRLAIYGLVAGHFRT